MVVVTVKEFIYLGAKYQKDLITRYYSKGTANKVIGDKLL
jgi:hypothetical protein